MDFCKLSKSIIIDYMNEFKKNKPKTVDGKQLDFVFQDDSKIEKSVPESVENEPSTEYYIEVENEDLKNNEEILKLKEEIEKDYINETSDDLYGRYTRIANEEKTKKEQQSDKPKPKPKTRKSKYPNNKNHKGRGYVSGTLGSFNPLD